MNSMNSLAVALIQCANGNTVDAARLLSAAATSPDSVKTIRLLLKASEDVEQSADAPQDTVVEDDSEDVVEDIPSKDIPENESAKAQEEREAELPTTPGEEMFPMTEVTPDTLEESFSDSKESDDEGEEVPDDISSEDSPEGLLMNTVNGIPPKEEPSAEKSLSAMSTKLAAALRECRSQSRRA